MTIGDIVRQGFHYARTCKSLWLFGFIVGIASSGGSSGGSGGSGANGGISVGMGGLAATGLDPFGLSATTIALIVAAFVAVVCAALVLRFMSEGALIEGVARVHHGGVMTTRDGFRAGWAHWGVLLRIGVLYVAAVIAMLVLLAAPCVVAFRALGGLGAVAVGIPAVVVAVPCFITLHLVQAFAARVAVLENRNALDAIRKARLFLHGRLMHGLKLIVATLVGTLLLTVLSIVVFVPIVLLLVALVPVLNVIPVIVVGAVVLLPAAYVVIAMLGTLRSSIWTIGYVTQAGA